jgi:hypothetical protein
VEIVLALALLTHIWLLSRGAAAARPTQASDRAVLAR